MIRFLAGKVSLDSVQNRGDMVALLGSMTEYLQTRDRDAMHILCALGYDDAEKLAGGLEPAKLLRRANRMAKMLALGQTTEFSRSPIPGDATDKGLYGDDLKDAVASLTFVANRGVALGVRIHLLRFSSKLVS